MEMLPLLLTMAGASLTLVLIAVAFAGPSTRRATSRRLLAVRERHSGSASTVAMDAQLRRIGNNRTSKADRTAQRILPNVEQLKLRLVQTGKGWTIGQYLMASCGLFAVTALLLLIKGMPFLLALLFGLFVGAGLPHFVVGKLIQRRVAKFTAKFPDAIELLVRGLRSGLPITETMGIVGNEVDGPVGEEFRAINDRMKIGRTLDAALQETGDRLGTPEFQFFIITIAIQRETGGNLAETLANLADVLRKRSQMKLKIRAMSSESKASAYIIGSLPFIVFGMIWFINGSYMQTFFIDPRLIVTGLGGMVWMGIGAFIMAKMINFEI
ncbi:MULTISPECIES: type II secretion system F family protein [unclassified Sphingomonas]|uniref:type II secretion system F family protein n=1 Tax=unclassified Sphingomonas TaxID=196159 RepID=UPI0006F55553|nr:MULTISPECIES: type II secretion system F family protein [unclassified Sphingomonas]KQN00299.1 pilus assembly protein TadB [Sphingomonas sp. Leaf25]KQN36595.1 pilus assembly protein TadB [Sphingomonas sp. Leaf42]KQT27217.1 pilus assembly protein TadB [Sphingomonas sp. Leaf407]